MKKFIALILVLMTVLSMNVIVLGTNAAGETVGADASTACADMSKAQDAPVEATAINSAADFAAITGSGIYYIAADNISITVSNENEFTGTLYGCGKTIKTTKALFANLKGTVQDLTVAANIIDATTNYGAVAAVATGATIKNVNVTGSIATGTVDEE